MATTTHGCRWTSRCGWRKRSTALASAHRLIVVKGARHGFETALKTPVERDLIPEIVDFLEQAWNRQIDETGRAKSPGPQSPNGDLLG